jgi:hypothetical protein
LTKNSTVKLVHVEEKSDRSRRAAHAFASQTTGAPAMSVQMIRARANGRVETGRMAGM